ncbi:MAG: hypothetical protein J3R72DRAFT_460138 [Linnemannia gamsii]|nr:MAG: hypothetical protein J3R72DRAFT_460138 [Linnemannia gamsii]
MQQNKTNKKSDMNTLINKAVFLVFNYECVIELLVLLQNIKLTRIPVFFLYAIDIPTCVMFIGIVERRKRRDSCLLSSPIASLAIIHITANYI